MKKKIYRVCVVFTLVSVPQGDQLEVVFNSHFSVILFPVLSAPPGASYFSV